MVVSNTILVQQFYEKLAGRDQPGAMSLLAENFTLIQAESLPYGGIYIGAKGVEEFFRKFFSFWKEFRSEQVEYVEHGNKVIATSIAIGVTRSRKEIRIPMIQVYIVEQKKLLSAQPFYFDTALILNSSLL